MPHFLKYSLFLELEVCFIDLHSCNDELKGGFCFQVVMDVGACNPLFYGCLDLEVCGLNLSWKILLIHGVQFLYLI